MSGPIHPDQRTNGQRHYERTVVDVSTEQECPKRPDQLVHEIVPLTPREAGADPLWACTWCRVSWADLDAEVRP